MVGGTTEENGLALIAVRADGTSDCAECDLPMTPVDLVDQTVYLECANRHRAAAGLPQDRATRALIDHWISKRWAQVHAQEERRRIAREAADAEEEG